MLPRRERKRVQRRNGVVTSDNDNVARALEDLVPESFHGTDRYLDIVEWNLEWFGSQHHGAHEDERYRLVLDVLTALNADLFVFEEIAGPTEDGCHPGALDLVANELTQRGAGNYRAAYTRAGGEQRVAFMWDREWVCARAEVAELFPVGTYRTDSGRDAFAQRTPLYGSFAARVPARLDDNRFGASDDALEFQVLGVHLKANADGAPQRLRSAEVLADWLLHVAPRTGPDALVIGDWNAPPEDACWKPIHALDEGPDRRVHFRDINDPSDFSYLWLESTKQYVSRIDLTAMSLASMNRVQGTAAQVVRWKPIVDALATAGNLQAHQVELLLEQIKEKLSDHLPTLSRFYFSQPTE